MCVSTLVKNYIESNQSLVLATMIMLIYHRQSGEQLSQRKNPARCVRGHALIACMAMH